MNLIISVRDWINNNLYYSFGIVLLFLSILKFICKIEIEILDSIMVVLLLYPLLSKGLLGIEYPNKINVFNAGRNLTISEVLFPAFYILSIISAFAMVKQGIISGVSGFIIFIIVGLVTVVIRAIIDSSKNDLAQPMTRKIIILEDMLIVYSTIDHAKYRKHIFKYEESSWKSKYDKIILGNGANEYITIDLGYFKTAKRALIADEIESRIAFASVS